MANSHPNIDVIANEENINLCYAANFVLSKCQRVNEFRIYPSIHDLTNRESSSTVTTAVTFPDVTVKNHEELNLTTLGGNFRDTCNDLGDESVDCVVTWFFLDTAHNVVEYICLIEKVLKSNGIWINMGGLDYIYEPFNGETSIELPLDDLKGIITDLGFLTVKEMTLENFEFQEYSDSFLRKMFNCPFFVCKKDSKKY